jgi:hypothetical protein
MMESMRWRHQKEKKEQDDLEEELEQDKFVKDALYRLDDLEASARRR